MINDTYVANDIIYRLLENGDADANILLGSPLLSNQFTIAEIIGCINRVQQQFSMETGLILTQATIPAAVGQATYDLPIDSIRPRRVSWQKVEP